jgi:hypothetical protein
VNRVALSVFAVTLVAASALAGSYGSVERRYAGFEASVNCSVGSMNPHSGEAEAMARRKQAGEAELAKREPELLAMFRHFVGGAHPYRRFLGRLDVTGRDVPFERRARVELSFPVGADTFLSPPVIVMSLYFKEPPGQDDAVKLAAEFAASQLAPGGALARVTQRAERDLADTQQLLLGAGGQIKFSPFPLVRLMAERRGEIAELARRNEPLPKRYAWQGDQRPALVVARILDAILAGRRIDDPLRAAVAALDPDPRADADALIRLLSP